MKRRLVIVAVLVVMAIAAVALWPGRTQASAAPASDLQVVASGDTGLMAVHYVCRRNFEGCVASTIHGCKGPC